LEIKYKGIKTFAETIILIFIQKLKGSRTFCKFKKVYSNINN